MISGLIDVHTHIVPTEFPAAPEGQQTRWPCMRCENAQSATIMMGDKPFRALDNRAWDVTRRLADMDRDGVTMQVLSPMPELLSYWFPAADTLRLGRYVNGAIAEMIAQAPARFAGLGTVPLQDPGLAAKELHVIKHEFGLAGVEIGSNVLGTVLGDPRFDIFYAAAEELDLAIFVHALHPVGAERLSDPLLTALIAFPLDTALTAASIIAAGVLDRFPKLRLGFSHGGGALLPVLHRLEHGWRQTEGFGGKVPEPPSAYAARMFYDSLVYDAAYLRHLTQSLAPGRIFAGTDYPFAIQQEDLADFLNRAGLDSAAQDDLCAGAAKRFLGLVE